MNVFEFNKLEDEDHQRVIGPADLDDAARRGLDRVVEPGKEANGIEYICNRRREEQLMEHKGLLE